VLDARAAFRDVPWKIAVEDDGKSFLKLAIKVKKKIVADGLADDAFDVTNVGTHLDAAAFHRNHQPTWAVLQSFLADKSGDVLEAGSRKADSDNA
jgi:predicted sulfurtransferase